MAGNYRQLKNGKWELCVSLGFGLDGKRKREYKYIEASGPREVEKMLAEFVAECTRATYSDGGKLKISEFADMWIKDHVKKNLKNKTVKDYEEKLERIKEYLGNIKLKDLKPTHLLQFYDILSEDGIRKNGAGGLSYSTQKHYHRILSSMLQDAVEWQLIKDNVCERVKPSKPKQIPGEKKKAKSFTIDEVRHLLEALNTTEMKYKVAIILTIFTGLRRGELMGVEWSDVDFVDNSIMVNKASYYTPAAGTYTDTTKTGDSDRKVYLPKAVMLMLKNYKLWWNGERAKLHELWHDSDRLFVQWNGKPMHPDTLSNWFPGFRREHGLPEVSIHGLRHTHGSILLAMGMDTASVADQMGHANIQMLIQTYSHNVKAKSKEAAEKMEEAILKIEENEQEKSHG
jgi:integrase